MWGKLLLLLTQVVLISNGSFTSTKVVFFQWKTNFFLLFLFFLHGKKVPCKSACSLMALLKYKLKQWRYELRFLMVSNFKYQMHSNRIMICEEIIESNIFLVRLLYLAVISKTFSSRTKNQLVSYRKLRTYFLFLGVFYSI